MGCNSMTRLAAGAIKSLLLLSVLALCGCPRVVSQEYVLRAYRQTSGLENLAVNSMAADHNGFLWIGTENGVYRFLGDSFQRFGAAQGIREPYIMQVFVAADGTLWVGSDRNLYRWTGQTFRKALSQPVKLIYASSLASDGAGSLLVIVGRDLYRLRYSSDGSSPDSERLERFFTPNQIAAHPSLGHLGAIAALPDGTLWMACAEMLCSWKPNASADAQAGVNLGSQDGTITEWSKPQGVEPQSYRAIFLDSQGEVWAISRSGNIVVLPKESDQARREFVDRSLPKAAGRNFYSRLPIATDRVGRVVVSMSREGGIARWDGSAWQTIGKSNGVISNHLTALLFDERGNLWMGSGGHGLYHWIGYDDWQGWLDSQGLPSANIWSIGPFEGNQVWVGTENGPAIIDSSSGLVIELPFAKQWPYGEISGVIAASGSPRVRKYPGASGGIPGGTLLIATSFGKVLKVEGHPARTTLVADLHENAYHFLRDTFGRTLLLTDSGVLDFSSAFKKRGYSMLQSTSHRAKFAKFQSPPQSRVLLPSTLPQIRTLLGPQAIVNQACVSPDGVVWFISENGLARMSREADREIWSRPLLQGFSNSPLTLSDVECAKDGSLWVNAAPDTAIWKVVYDPGLRVAAGTSPIADRLVATRLPLPSASQSTTVVNMFADPSGLLWVGTDDGVLVWNGSVWRHLTQEDGLIWNDVNAPKMARGPDGSIWVATSGGLSRILHPERLFPPHPPRIAMIEVRIGEHSLPLDGSLELPWSRRDMRLQFAAPDVLNRADLRFHYRLAGLQPDWIESRDQTAHFQTLPPGEYSFEVFALDTISRVHSGTIAFRFRVMPPWWRTWWFNALCGIAVTLIFTSILRLRTRRILAQQRRLESMVLERTSQLEASREELQHQANHDGLTGLANRVAVLEAFDQELARARRDGTTLTVALADIDHFKHINDTYGHLAGDEALRRFSRALAASVRSYDHVGRYGGEEFLLIFINIDPADIDLRLTALHNSISGLNIIYDGAEFTVNCSMGAIQINDLAGGSEQKLALAAADEALYEAKRTGRNRFIVGNLMPKGTSALCAD